MVSIRIFAIGIVIIISGCSDKNISIPVQKTVIVSLVCKDENVTVVTDDVQAPQEIETDIPETSIIKVNDLDHYPQEIGPYVDKNGINQEQIYEVQKHFEENYYRPWSYQTPPICAKEAAWPIGAFKSGFGSNLKPLPISWFKEMEAQCNFQAFATVNQYAITTKWMNIRVFPTAKPLYKNPARAGDGYPFDLLQNSSVAFNEPIFISHASLDGSYCYVFTNNASGWIEADGVAVITTDQIERLRSKEKLFINEDKVPLYNNENRFVAYSRIGMVLPLFTEKSDAYKALYVDNKGEIKELSIPKESASIGSRLINKDDLIKLGSNVLRNTYGWGGMFEERDCSSMIRDFVTPFGIWLPRNSAQQAKKGELISFKDLNNTQKIALIKEKGVPFETILYKKGHVLLYVGTYEDNVMVLHTIWGIRTKDKDGAKGRAIIGRTVISTLELGRDVENFDFSNMLLSTLVSMNIFTKPPVQVVRQKSKVKLTSL
jgi:hypothetical protein